MWRTDSCRSYIHNHLFCHRSSERYVRFLLLADNEDEEEEDDEEEEMIPEDREQEFDFKEFINR